MKPAHRYSFRPVTTADLDVLMTWQLRPHVREWWDSIEPGSPQDLEDVRVRRWIVSCDQHPFAYMQDYTVHGWEDHHFYGLPEGSRGIDQFIGEFDMIGQGHGPAFVAKRLHVLFAEGAPVIATDPHPANARAIAAYKKSGFTVCGPEQDTRWGRILPMSVCQPTGNDQTE
ncbi:MAG: GNAT family N-acetyltransferase [Pseudomonadota bacterium]